MTTDHSYPARRIAEEWHRERPGTPTDSIEILTPLRRIAKHLTDDRATLLRQLNVDPAILDLLATLRRSGPPYTLTTRQIKQRTLVTAGAISQRLTRAEKDGLITRTASDKGHLAIDVTLTDHGHHIVENTVDTVLERENDLIDCFDDRERAMLTGLLNKLLYHVSDRTTGEKP